MLKLLYNDVIYLYDVFVVDFIDIYVSLLFYRCNNVISVIMNSDVFSVLIIILVGIYSFIDRKFFFSWYVR